MPYALVLDSEVTDTSLPILYPDPGMSPGTLFLFDVAHSQSGLTAGVVPTSGTLSNIARDTAAAALGKSASLLDWSPSYARSNGDASLKVERTTKGGIHVVSSQVGQTTGNSDNDFWRIELMNDLKQAMLDAIPGSAIFSMNWYVVTRLGLTSSAKQSIMHMTNAASATGNYAYFTKYDRIQSGDGGGFARQPGAEQPVNTPSIMYVASSAWYNAKPASVATAIISPATLGRDTAWRALNRNTVPSLILYRSKVEDLSKTKRANGGAGGTFAEEAAAALAVEQALFNAAFAPGGKFYGDTWSDPATFLL